MKRCFLLFIGCVCSAVLAFSCIDPTLAQQERIRIGDIQTINNPFDPRSGQQVIITGNVVEFVGESAIVAPSVSALIEEKIEVPVTLSPGESTEAKEEASDLNRREWRFSLAWDGTVPWDLFPQGRYICIITAESKVKPGLRAIQPVRLYIQPANPHSTQ